MSLLQDDEVFAVILAVSIVASVLGTVLILRPFSSEKFSAIGLLDENCKIGNYPEIAVNGTEIKLCLFVYNHLGEPAYYKIVYRIGNNDTLPSNLTSSPAQEIKEWKVILNNDENTTFPFSVPVFLNANETDKAALIFELWAYNMTIGNWEYTGLWTDLYINVTKGG
jgi:uncharacterized membrane protein